MTVNKEIIRLEKSSVKLTINIDKDDVRSEYNEILKDYTKSVQIPGFRKGKVPSDVLERKFGDALKGETMGKIIEKTLDEILSDESLPRENKPLPYSRPKLENEEALSIDWENDFKFSVVYDVLPAVKIEKFEGFEVEVPDVSIEEEDIARELEEIRERNSIVLDKDEGEAALTGDVVTVDYCELEQKAGETSFEVLADSERQDFSFTLGTGYNIYKIDDEIVGMKKGETKEFSKTYPDDENDKMLAGKTKQLRVTLSALKVKKLPDLDDDLAQDVDEKFKTLDDLKNSIRERMNKDLEERLKSKKINSILEEIMEKTPVNIPESMLRIELDSRWRNLARNFGTDPEGLYKVMNNTGGNPNAIIEEWKPDAEKALHSRLIVETLMEDLKLEVPDEEIEKEIEKISLENKLTLDEAKKYYEGAEMREILKEDIKERKVYDILLEKNTVKAGKKEKYIDLISNNR